jgi:Zn-dependent M28 family amino/carboxypeptidase
MAFARAACCAAAVVLAACEPLADAAPDLSADRLLADIQVLAADSLEGRAPGTPGEEKTVQFLEAQFRAAGLAPGNPDGTYIQTVEMVGINGTPTANVTIGTTPIPLAFGDDYVLSSRRTVPEVVVLPSEIVFVGYGVEAPEYGWNDFKDVDVRGKVILMLVGDPAVPSAANPAVLDSAMFRGPAMTYYGRWTYKYEIASAKGAAGAIIIHDDAAAGYGWGVVKGSWSGRELIDLRSADNNAGRVAVEGWITSPKASELFTAAGLDLDSLRRVATSKAFRPVSLSGTAGFRIAQQVRDIRSRNVVARLPGSDPALAAEHVIFTAHWDHLGIVTPVNGDSIANGARDNASGTAGIVELARAFATAGAPKRSLLFLAVTAEESGLLGAKWYAEHPLYPLERTVANINVDVLNAWGPTSDITVVGLGNTTLEDVLREVAQAEGRTVVGDSEPEKGFFYRSDHFEFAKKGVPALYVDEGKSYLDRPPEYGEQQNGRWLDSLYHQPADSVESGWDLRGAINDLTLLYRVGRTVADAEVWPTWKPGTEFKAIRERMLGTGN